MYNNKSKSVNIHKILLPFYFHSHSTCVVACPLFLIISHLNQFSTICADIAVGAPFDGDGKVFIYRGSDAGIETKPAQVSHKFQAAVQD